MCPHLSFSHPLFSLCRTVRGMEAEVSRSSPPLCVAVVEGDPVFPAVERRQVVPGTFPSSPPASLPPTPRLRLLLLLELAMDGV